MSNSYSLTWSYIKFSLGLISNSYLIPLHREASAVEFIVIVVDWVGKTISGQ